MTTLYRVSGYNGDKLFTEYILAKEYMDAQIKFLEEHGFSFTRATFDRERNKALMVKYISNEMVITGGIIEKLQIFITKVVADKEFSPMCNKQNKLIIPTKYI